jgi:hypothetical protein
MATPFAQRLSKNERRVFLQPHKFVTVSVKEIQWSEEESTAHPTTEVRASSAGAPRHIQSSRLANIFCFLASFQPLS